jgi:ArsR family transcriptional regulator, arsenate/arsenite/antimonite-responsive transcriptional repressor
MRKAGRNFYVQLFSRALADRTRLRLLNLMGGDEVCVCFFVEILNVNQPRISRHLAYLRKAGIVAARKEGIWMHYRIVKPRNEDAAVVFREVTASLAEDPEMQKDRKKLVNVCCTPNPPAHLPGEQRSIPISTAAS